MWRRCQKNTKKWWTIFSITNFQTKPTNNSREGLPLRHTLMPIFGDYLYHQGKDGVLWQVVEKEDVSTLLFKFHEGVYEGHFVGRIIAKKILWGRYHWSTFSKDAIEYCKTCDVCKTFVNKFVVHVPSLEKKHIYLY
jgi:hypothetical protein